MIDARILNLVNNHVYFLHKSEEQKTDTYIEYHIISEKYDDFTSNKANTVRYIIQVSIFSKYDYEEIENTVKQVLLEKGYSFSHGVDLYEEDTKLYHKAMRFNIKIINKLKLKNESEEF